jgi:hypothetical protein
MSETGPAAVLSYVAAGALIILVMRMLGEMAVASPATGSFVEYCRQALGPRAGFTVGWLYWYFWAIVLAIEAVAGATILERWIDAPMRLMSLILMTLLTATNLWSVKSYGEFEFWFASIKVAAILGFIAIAAGWLLGIGGGDSPGLSNLTAHDGFFAAGIPTVLRLTPAGTSRPVLVRRTAAVGPGTATVLLRPRRGARIPRGGRPAVPARSAAGAAIVRRISVRWGSRRRTGDRRLLRRCRPVAGAGLRARLRAVRVPRVRVRRVVDVAPQRGQA